MKTRYALIATVALALSCIFLSAALAQEPEALKTETELWASGQVRVRKILYPDGVLKEKIYYWESGIMEQDEKYDKEGHKIEESHYDGDGKLVDTMEGWAAMRYTYEDGVLRVQTSFDATGRIIERKFYSASGDLVDKQYVGDNNIDPYEEYNPTPVLGTEEIQYFDENGVPEGDTSVTIE